MWGFIARRQTSGGGNWSPLALGLLILLVTLSVPPRAGEIDSASACCQLIGDVDHNGEIRSSDIIALVVYLFKGGAQPACPMEADANLDGIANAADLIFLVAYVFRGGVAPDSCQPLVFIQHLQPGDNTVTGLAYVPDTAEFSVVLFAKTDRWYVQPFASEPYTAIQSNGSWSNSIHPWERVVALLVDSQYVPTAILDQHPSAAPGVVAWDEYPEKSADIYVDWSGYRWRVKDAVLTSPGPNAFSNDTANVRIDDTDRLHLKTDFREARWYCAEIILDHALGYGVYSFKLDSRVDNLNYNTIFAGFIYDSTGQEFDMEFSQFLADPYNAQFVIQPWYLPGHIDFYNMPALDQTSFSWEWRGDRIEFQSWRGHADTATATTLIHSWVYTGGGIPIPGADRMRFNLYLANGNPPSGGTQDAVIVREFAFVN